MTNKSKYLGLILGLSISGFSINTAKAVNDPRELPVPSSSITEEAQSLLNQLKNIEARELKVEEINPKILALDELLKDTRDGLQQTDIDSTLIEPPKRPITKTDTRVVIGAEAEAEQDSSIAIGHLATANGPQATSATAIGHLAIANNHGSTALGLGSKATGRASSGIGAGAQATGKYATAVGFNTSATNEASFALGEYVGATAQGSMVIGRGYDTGVPNAGNRGQLSNNKEDSLAVGFNSDKATLFVGASEGKGTTGNVGIGTDTPRAKLDVRGDLLVETVSTNRVNAGTMLTTPKLISNEAIILDLESHNISSKNITSGTEKTDSLIVKQDADINILKAGAGSIVDLSAQEVKTDNLYSRLAQIKNIASDLIEAKELTTDEASINKARISELNVKQAKIKALTTNHLEAKESFTENFFVGTRQNSKVESAALVAYEKLDIEDVEDTPEISRKKSKIQYYERKAAAYYRYATRYAQYSWASRYKTIADKTTQRVQDLNLELQNLIKQQSNETKKIARVGVGLSDPQQTLHISGAMRLEPLASAPTNVGEGDMYVNKTGALCVYLNNHWNYVTGDGRCTE